MHALGAEQQDRHGDIGPAVEVDFGQNLVIHEGSALVLQNAGGKAVLRGIGSSEELRQHGHKRIFAHGLQHLVRRLEVQSVGFLGKGRVALPPSTGFFRGIRRWIRRLGGIQQRDERHVRRILATLGALMQRIGHLISQRATAGPPAEHDLAAASVVQDVLDISLGALLQRALDALYAVDCHVLGQASG